MAECVILNMSFKSIFVFHTVSHTDMYLLPTLRNYFFYPSNRYGVSLVVYTLYMIHVRITRVPRDFVRLPFNVLSRYSGPPREEKMLNRRSSCVEATSLRKLEIESSFGNDYFTCEKDQPQIGRIRGDRKVDVSYFLGPLWQNMVRFTLMGQS